jgi:hypothetical protein
MTPNRAPYAPNRAPYAPNRAPYAPNRARACIAVLLAGIITACGSPSGDDPSADGGPGDPDAQPADPCDALRDAPDDDKAIVELFDPYVGEQPIPLLLEIDGCVIVGGALQRGGSFGQGFLPGNRTFTITVDGVQLPPQQLDADHGDAFWFAMDLQSPPQLHRVDGSYLPAADDLHWSVYLMNMGDLPLTIERAIDPGAQVYETLVRDLPLGEAFVGDVAVFPENGAPVRMTRQDGVVIFEENLGFVLACDAGEWIGGLAMFVLIDDIYPRIYIVYPRDPCP